VGVAAGDCHSAFVTEAGELYVCGSDRWLQLGQPVLCRKAAQLSVPHSKPMAQSLSASQSPSPRQRLPLQPLLSPRHGVLEQVAPGGKGEGGVHVTDAVVRVRKVKLWRLSPGGAALMLRSP
jgi:alpha-tubulin suppressor-like RCC1 family protein